MGMTRYRDVARDSEREGVPARRGAGHAKVTLAAAMAVLAVGTVWAGFGPTGRHSSALALTPSAASRAVTLVDDNLSPFCPKDPKLWPKTKPVYPPGTTPPPPGYWPNCGTYNPQPPVASPPSAAPGPVKQQVVNTLPYQYPANAPVLAGPPPQPNTAPKAAPLPSRPAPKAAPLPSRPAPKAAPLPSRPAPKVAPLPSRPVPQVPSRPEPRPRGPRVCPDYQGPGTEQCLPSGTGLPGRRERPHEPTHPRGNDRTGGLIGGGDSARTHQREPGRNVDELGSRPEARPSHRH